MLDSFEAIVGTVRINTIEKVVAAAGRRSLLALVHAALTFALHVCVTAELAPQCLLSLTNCGVWIKVGP